MKRKLLLLLLIPMVLVVVNIMSFFLDDYGADFSLTQKYRPFHSVYNWNLPTGAFDDFDKDGKEDKITFGGCAYISETRLKDLTKNQQCQDPNYIVSPEIQRDSIGQQLPFGDPSFVVLTKAGTWKYYAYDLLWFQTYELRSDNIFQKVNPTLQDIVDYVWYMPSHFLLILVPF